MKLETMMERGMRSSRSVGPLVVALVLAVLTATAAGAQLDPGAKAPMASQAPAAASAPAAMPMPMPNPALDQLKFFAGNWQCAGTGYLEGKGHPTSATVNMGWDLNGFFMSLRYEEKKTGVNPMPLTAVEHWGYSDELKKLVAGHVDSMGGYGTEATAGWEGNTMVWVGDDHMMGMRMPGRDTFVKHGDNEVTHLGEIQQNGAWIKQDEESCYRVK
ncbi:MAG TPA: hypothetical protein VOA80_12950 [Thermoanaerobaculia bacterium]|nr:hypothetical protein [Thermoanaerobaculia bacterium]